MRIVIILFAVLFGPRWCGPGQPQGKAIAKAPAAEIDRPTGSPMAPYAPDPEHLWNRLHRALFVRTTPEGELRVHTTDPLLYHGITREHNGVMTFGTFFLLQGESHSRAVALLDQFLDSHGERLIPDPLKRLFLQRDLWAAFDYASWYPDDWVYHTRHVAAARALRGRLARVIDRLALSDREIKALPDNYQLAVKSKRYPTDYDPEHPERPFLPANLFDPTGPWFSFHEVADAPMARQHFEGAGGRAGHVICLRLPGGRAATEKYLKELASGPINQFPPGTMVAMVRRPLVVDQSVKMQTTSLTELVQIRVYRRIPVDLKVDHQVDVGAQDAYEFVLDRGKLFAGQPGLRAVGPDEPAESFRRDVGDDPFDPLEKPVSPPTKPEPQLKTCIYCHQGPGVFSVHSLQRGLQAKPRGTFQAFEMKWEPEFTKRSKIKRFDWGLLQGMIEATRSQDAPATAKPLSK